ncbi:hypothetical protein B0T26DRAFT_730417 [Lasiosphaeria miniovina]|uniref:Uncharacterized protein n=1 Tax=Lasiosphaeria miniovina TaxID=1954250 RepID=A0AA39ZTH8_9PEZI|nr:uncharacterized protein B0T26DRAFT_730417 [Lasiosphaeria miniovina]KAK0703239.1 hypothetical protein B0T26DRAFT_730417 [Lasiosphaeria miniovina]
MFLQPRSPLSFEEKPTMTGTPGLLQPLNQQPLPACHSYPRTYGARKRGTKNSTAMPKQDAKSWKHHKETRAAEELEYHKEIRAAEELKDHKEIRAAEELEISQGNKGGRENNAANTRSRYEELETVRAWSSRPPRRSD